MLPPMKLGGRCTSGAIFAPIKDFGAANRPEIIWWLEAYRQRHGRRPSHSAARGKLSDSGSRGSQGMRSACRERSGDINRRAALRD